MISKKLDLIQHNGIDWLELKQAARYTRVKASELETQGKGGRFDLLVRDGKIFIPLGIANRIKRETSSLRGIERMTKNERKTNVSRNTSSKVGISHPGFSGKQDVLPMSSGRGGTDWIGQRSPIDRES